jgi:hypothetical protein
VQAGLLTGIEGVGGAGRIETDAPQDLVDEEVPETGDTRLIHEDGLQGRTRGCHHAAQLGEGELHGVHPETVLVRIELDRTEATRVAQRQSPAVDEAHRETMPLGDIAVARIPERIAGSITVDHHAAAHAEMQPDHWATGLCDPIGVEEQLLAAPAGRDEAPTR